jgi:RNA polymerase sigma factor (sigma-70 family)
MMGAARKKLKTAVTHPAVFCKGQDGLSGATDMATATTHPLIHHIRRLAGTQPASDLPDAHLLARFAGSGDQAAFETLLRRHGPLVLGVCRRVLGDWHAAEDCFQTVCILLARRAGSLRQPERLGPWLYGVAYRTALKARDRAARRGASERQAAIPPAVEPADDLVWRDLRSVLDDAVARLPEKYRTPFVLHYLQGRTVDEVAGRLGAPRGTIATRLARARAQLQKGLTRRGLALPGTALAALATQAASACLPAVLRTAAARAAVAAARGMISEVGPAPVAGLAQGGGTLMLTGKLKVAALVLLGLGVAGGGVALWRPGLSAGDPGASAGAVPQRAAPATAPEGDLILFLDGSTHFGRAQYRAAADAFAHLGREHPRSRLATAAARLAVLARQLAEGTAADSQRAASAGRAAINAALGSPSIPALERPDRSGRQTDDIRGQQADRDLRIAEFYRRTGHLSSACFYYEVVTRRYPGTTFATKAAERLRDLRKTVGPRPQPGAGAPARVGTVRVNGNRQTPDALILYQLPLRPGEVLTYPALSAAQRNLAALRGITATVSVSEAPGGLRDVLVQVEEQAGGADSKPSDQSRESRTPLLPPLTPGQRSACDDPPDLATILRALARGERGVPYLSEVFRDDLEVSVERLADQIHPPRFYPLIGHAQLHRCHYKCVVCYNETTQSSWPFPFQCTRRRSEIVYLDRDHLHLMPGGEPPGKDAPTPTRRTPPKAGRGV